MFIHEIRLKSLLSFGPDGGKIPLGALNVIVGPNGAGKSNFIESFALLKSTPGKITTPIREGGGVGDWIWKGPSLTTQAEIDVVVDSSALMMAQKPLRYGICFGASGNRFEILDERVEYSEKLPSHRDVYFFYRFENNHPVLNTWADKDRKKQTKRSVKRETIDPERSILAQRRDPELYPEITFLAEEFAKIRIYRDWSFGRYTPPRMPQKADLQNDWLEEDASNLGLVLSNLRQNPEAKSIFLEFFREVYDGADDFEINIVGGTVQVFVQEGNRMIPATRLSDGTLRYLALLSVLCHPAPPPLICIDEPELGMHPDLIGKIAEALRYAAGKTQIIVTTHSVQLVDAMTDTPENVIVCEKPETGTRLSRLEQAKLEPWLEKYSLGSIWSKGEIGGNRW